MQTFHISAQAGNSAYRTKNIDVDTSLDGGAAMAKVTRRSDVTNPLYVASFGTIGPPGFFERTTSHTVTGSAPLDDAVSALHALGERHGVTGILLSSSPELVGGMMLESAPGHYLTNSAETKAIGAAALRQIDDAARAVLDLATASH